MIDIMTKGGILMWPLLLCGIISLGVIIERSIVLYRIRIKNTNFMNEIKENLRSGYIYKALALCDSLSGPIPLVIKDIIKKYEQTKKKINYETEQRIVDSVSLREIPKLEKNIIFLAVIAYVSPLIGLLGTVVGMIKAFIKIQQLSGVVNPSDLAQGIWNALLTTAAGLTVAIPTLILYNFYISIINKTTERIELNASDITEFVNEQFDKDE